MLKLLSFTFDAHMKDLDREFNIDSNAIHMTNYVIQNHIFHRDKRQCDVDSESKAHNIVLQKHVTDTIPIM